MNVYIDYIYIIGVTQSAAKSVASVTVAHGAGRAIVTNILKAIPGGAIFGSAISATTAVALTEALGWIVADDFYRMSTGEEPENIAENVKELKSAFEGMRMHKE